MKLSVQFGHTGITGMFILRSVISEINASKIFDEIIEFLTKFYLFKLY